MNKTELKKLAVKQLHTKNIQTIRKKVCQQQKDCMVAFDKNFVKSFIDSYQKKM